MVAFAFAATAYPYWGVDVAIAAFRFPAQNAAVVAYLLYLLYHQSLSANVFAAVHPCKRVVVAHSLHNLAHNPRRKMGAGVVDVAPDHNRRLGVCVVDVGVMIAGIQLWDAGVAVEADRAALEASVVSVGAAPPFRSHLVACPVRRPGCCPVLCGRYSCGMLVSLSDWRYSLLLSGNALFSGMCRVSKFVVSLLSTLPVLRMR